mgnify:CR=1 FL=1
MNKNIVESKVYRINPGYLSKYDVIIKSFSQFGGGAKDDRYIQGKSFSNTYEFYMYAFFVGLYKNIPADLHDDDDLTTFWEVDNWKPREMVDHMLVCALSKSDFDMLAVEKFSEPEVTAEVRKLKRTIESYANGGLEYIFSLVQGEIVVADDFFIKQLA